MPFFRRSIHDRKLDAMWFRVPFTSQSSNDLFRRLFNQPDFLAKSKVRLDPVLNKGVPRFKNRELSRFKTNEEIFTEFIVRLDTVETQEEQETINRI